MPFTLTMPKLSPTMEEGIIAKWHKKEGDFIEAGDLLFEISTDKATVEHNALDPGWLRKILVPNGGEAKVNQAIAVLTEEKDESIEDFKVTEEKKETADEEEKVADVAQEKSEPKVAYQQPVFVPEPPLTDYKFAFPREEVQGRIKASPLAKKLAAEENLDLTTVKGSGPGGRIVKQDLPKAQMRGPVCFSQKKIPSVSPGTYVEEPLSPIRRVAAERIQSSKSFVPHFYVHQTCRVDALVKLHKQLKSLGFKITYNDFAVRACALALREHPNINSGFNSENQTFVRFKTIDITIAVDTEDGLMTPIIRHADYKNLAELSVESRSLAAKAKEGSLKLEQFKGGSFSVSNLGMFGVSSFEAVINPPQGAIVAVGGIEDAAVVEEGKIVPGKTMKLCFSFDHRIIDGAAGAKFAKSVQRLLEQPVTLAI